MIKQEWDDQQDHPSQQVTHQTCEPMHMDREEEDKHYINPIKLLHSANPILPPGRYHQKVDTKSLKHKFLNRTDKLNKTTFPEVNAKTWLNRTHQSGMTNNKKLKQIYQEEEQNNSNDIMQFLGGQHQFRQFLQDKKLIYLRINNMKYNKIGFNQAVYFASFFINTLRETITAKKVPVLEHLANICQDIRPIKLEDGHPVQFDSKFQSGNLFCAFLSPEETIPTYDLFMQNDTNTKGCTQWFYFSVCSQKRIKLRLRIVNFYKPTSLYLKGMKVLVTSSDKQPNMKSQWKRIGTAIQYKRTPLGSGKESYSLEFMYEIEHPHRKYYFSYGFPYTYCELEQFLLKASHEAPLYSRIVQKTHLCRSYLGNNVPMLTVTDNIKTKPEGKPIIYIIGRQHPGETPGSFILEGIIRTLLSNRTQMERLRQNFVIKVVPMVNVDGVICGNYRSNFSGNDVNRQWSLPSKKLHPQLYNLKQEILNNRKNAYFFLDVHAHSRKMNSFFYGSRPANFQDRLYPFICSKLSNHISYFESSFIDDPSKKTTARVVLELQAGIKKSLTFETSFYGWENEKMKAHFKVQDYRNMGESLALGLFYSQIGMSKRTEKEEEGNEKKKSELERKIERNIEKISEKWKKQVQKYENEEQILSEGSSLDPEHFQLNEEEGKELQTVDEHLSKFEAHNSLQNAQKNENIKDRYPNVLVIKNKIKSLKKGEEKLPREVPKLNEKQLHLNPEMVMDERKFNNTSFFTLDSNLRNTQNIKKTELAQVKNNRKYRSNNNQDYKRKLLEERQNQFKNQMIKGERFKSIQVESEPKPQYQLREMKRTFNIFTGKTSFNIPSRKQKLHKFISYSNGHTLILSQQSELQKSKRKEKK